MKTKIWTLFGGRVIVSRTRGAFGRLWLPRVSYVPQLGLTLALFARSVTFSSQAVRALATLAR